MSALVAFVIKDDIKYEKLVELSKDLISYSLKNNIGVIFNFLGYAEELMRSLNAGLYFSVSDDFLQLNSEFLTVSEINDLESEQGKHYFYEKFTFLDNIYKRLIEFGCKKIEFIISCNGNPECITDEFLIKDKGGKAIVEILYDALIEVKDKFAYSFPELYLI